MAVVEFLASLEERGWDACCQVKSVVIVPALRSTQAGMSDFWKQIQAEEIQIADSYLARPILLNYG